MSDGAFRFDCPIIYAGPVFVSVLKVVVLRKLQIQWGQTLTYDALESAGGSRIVHVEPYSFYVLVSPEIRHVDGFYNSETRIVLTTPSCSPQWL